MYILKDLKKNQLLANLKGCEFSQRPLVYLGYAIGGGELKIDREKMEAIIKLLVLNNVTELRRFVGVVRYLQKFISSLLVVDAPLHAITMSIKNL